MRNSVLVAAIFSVVLLTGCKSSQRSTSIGCATCIYDMKDVRGCKLAVKVDGKPYLVTGSSIDDHGDAHAADGLCNTERKARVEGKVEGDRFVAKRIEVLPEGK